MYRDRKGQRAAKDIRVHILNKDYSKESQNKYDCPSSPTYDSLINTIYSLLWKMYHKVPKGETPVDHVF